jgi:aspartate aminotransferase
MMDEYEVRRNWLIPALNEVDGFKCGMPEGAFYAFLDVRELTAGKFATSAEVADLLLNEAHVVVTDGAGFGAEGYLRISYATSMENLHTAVSKMKQVFN